MNSMLLFAGDTIKPDEIKVPKETYDWVEPPTNIAK